MVCARIRMPENKVRMHYKRKVIQKGKVVRCCLDTGTQWKYMLLLSRFSCVRLSATPETAAHQAPLSLGFSRQEHWSGFPSPMHGSEK